MDTFETEFFQLLNSGLWGTTISFAPEKKFDIDRILYYAQKQSVLSLIADALLRNASDNISEKDAKILQKIIFTGCTIHQRFNSVLLKLVSLLEENNVNYVLLKGQGIAQMYRIPELRTCGDIDIYVGEEGIVKAATLINTIIDPGSEKETVIIGKHQHARVCGIPIELHRRSADMATAKKNVLYRQIESAGLDQQNLDAFKLNGKSICLPDPTFNIFFTFYHALYHIVTGGLGVRQLCDIAVMLSHERDKIDFERLTEILTNLDLLQEWKTFMYVLVHYLGLEKDNAPLYSPLYSKKARKVIDLVLLEGNFGKFRKDRSKRKKEYSWFVRKLRNLYILTVRSTKPFRIFPGITLENYRKVFIIGILRAIGFKKYDTLNIEEE